MTYLSDTQVQALLSSLHPNRVKVRDRMSYVEAHDVKAHLTRIFGFARWSSEVVEQVIVCDEPVQTKAGKDAWYVVYRSVVKLTVRAPDGTELAVYTEGHVGESTHPQRGEAHGNAVTNSESYALKRCAIGLGDQFGLSLYNKGQTDPLVRWTVGPTRARTLDDGTIQIVGRDAEAHANEAVPDVHDETPADVRDADYEPPAKPAPVSELDKQHATKAGITTEVARAIRLREQAATREALGVDSSGRVKGDEKGRVTRTTTARDPQWENEPDPAFPVEADGQAAIDV